jgi:hypothetical protein
MTFVLVFLWNNLAYASHTLLWIFTEKLFDFDFPRIFIEGIEPSGKQSLHKIYAVQNLFWFKVYTYMQLKVYGFKVYTFQTTESNKMRVNCWVCNIPYRSSINQDYTYFT